MIKRELAKDDKLKNESWERFLPTIPHKNTSKRKQPAKKRVKKEYTPFPPAPTDRKVDKLLATGEYFLKEEQRRQKKKYDNIEKRDGARRKERRESAFVPPQEPSPSETKKSANASGFNVQEFKDKIRKSQDKRKQK